jgi:hypothetical protein
MTRKVNIVCNATLYNDYVDIFKDLEEPSQLNINILGDSQVALSALAKFDGTSLYLDDHTDMVLYALSGSLNDICSQLESSSMDDYIFDYCKVFGPKIEIDQLVDQLYESLSQRDDFVTSHNIDSSMNNFTIALMGCEKSNAIEFLL